MQFFIKDFPDLEDEAINAVYDLCEDQVSQVSTQAVETFKVMRNELVPFFYKGPDQRLRCHRQRL